MKINHIHEAMQLSLQVKQIGFDLRAFPEKVAIVCLNDKNFVREFTSISQLTRFLDGWSSRALIDPPPPKIKTNFASGMPEHEVSLDPCTKYTLQKKVDKILAKPLPAAYKEDHDE